MTTGSVHSVLPTACGAAAGVDDSASATHSVHPFREARTRTYVTQGLSAGTDESLTAMQQVDISAIFQDLQEDLLGILQHQVQELEEGMKKTLRGCMSGLKDELCRTEEQRPTASLRPAGAPAPSSAYQAWQVRAAKSPECSPPLQSSSRPRHYKPEDIRLPTAKLQIACLEKLAAHGRAEAERVVLNAGYFGGNTAVIQVFCFTVGVFLAILTPLRVGDRLFGVPEVKRLAWMSKMLWLSAQIPAGVCWIMRGYFLRVGRTALAHQMFLGALLSYGLLRPIECVFHIFMTAYYGGCSWYQAGFLFEEAGEACMLVHILAESSIVVLCIGSVQTACSLYQLRRITAQNTFCLSLCWGGVTLSFYFIAKVAFNRFSAWDLADLMVILGPMYVASYILQQRRSQLQRARDLVKDDIDKYDKVWRRIEVESKLALGHLAQVVQMEQEVRMAGFAAPTNETVRIQSTLLDGSDDPSAVEARQLLNELSLLYVQAYALNDHFQTKCASWAAGVGRHVRAPPKRTTRAIEKMFRSYRGDPSKLLDLVRSSIVCDTVEEVLDIFKRITTDPSAGIVRMKNRFNPHYDSSESGGYRNLALNIVIMDSFTERTCCDMHICELQIQLQDIDKLRVHGGHRRFTDFRNMRAE
eukprot:TRINITY_DN37933_c0_g1_i1.p1 TRINITY_DN37933_c0_g1~~TRINITY_DN37933_c0_g1_i1.p1  ORF type:complete len:641 (-),score=105.01 TRINITY_DN37933_c0_g1_i1:160-2082(-)